MRSATDESETPERLFEDIVDLLTQIDDIPQQALRSFYIRHGRTDKVPNSFNPKNRTTWGHVLARGNLSKAFGQLNHDTIARLIKLLPPLKLVDPSDLTEKNTQQLLKVIRDKLRAKLLGQKIESGEGAQALFAPATSSTSAAALTSAPSAADEFSPHLSFIGDAAMAVEKFALISRGATVAYNTIFTRSDPTLSYLVLKFIPDFQQLQVDLIVNDECTWIDIVRDDPGELKYAYEIRRRIGRHKRRYTIKKIKTKIPLLQLLVIKRDENSGAAFVGWLHEGTSTSMVWFTENREAVDWYFDYCRELSECGKEDSVPNKRRSNRRASQLRRRSRS